MAATLQDPATYRHSPFHGGATPEAAIELCETHVSWIALVGPFAYKVKKPVHPDFLDYSTLEKRHAACLVELDLNRRWAPELYLGLSRLVRAPTGLSFDTDGEIVEYAVRMKRFDRAAELDQLLARHAVEAHEVASLGAAIAGHHSLAARSAGEFGSPAALLRAAAQNLATLRGAQPGHALDVLSEWTEQSWPDAGRHLEARRAAGRVRECHGDLHCQNVVRLHGRLVPFDGIDFDPALRNIDVASDIAFLVMDLEARGRPDLAMACLNAYLERSGDYAAGHCMRFLLVYRALVRAKIAALRVGQLGGSAARTAAAESASYVAYAGSCARRPPGALVLMHGYSGSGKSTLAAALVPAWPAVQIRSDVLRRRLVPAHAGHGVATATDEDRYAPGQVDRTYEQLALCAAGLLQAGLNVIADATFLEARRRAPFVELARQVGCPVLVVSCEASPEVLRERVAARRNDASEATLAVLERQLASGDPLPDDGELPVITVRTDPAPRAWAVCAAISAAIAARPSRRPPAESA